jgi:hypothetical protein
MRVHHTGTWQPDGGGRFSFSGPATSNVVSLSVYRRQHGVLPDYFGTSDLIRPRRSAESKPHARTDADYAARMKANAAIFVFLIFFVLSGVWLMDGLAQAFGH